MISDYLLELQQSLLYDDEDVEADEKKREEEENAPAKEVENEDS